METLAAGEAFDPDLGVLDLAEEFGRDRGAGNGGLADFTPASEETNSTLSKVMVVWPSARSRRSISKRSPSSILVCVPLSSMIAYAMGISVMETRGRTPPPGKSSSITE